MHSRGDSMEKYKITKTIRFKLEPKHISKIQSSVESIKSEDKFDLASFISSLSSFISQCNEYLFYKNRNGEFIMKTKLAIKSVWLKEYARQEIAGSGLKRGQTIGDIKGLSDKIKKATDEINAIYTELSDETIELNERANRARKGLLIKRLAARNALPLLLSLIENTTDKNETGNLSIQLKQLGAKLQSQLISGINMYLPLQSGGLPITKASFNYYAINKNPIVYEEKKQKQIDRLKIDLDSKKFDSLIPRGINISKLLKDAIKLDILERGEKKIIMLGDAPFIEPEDCVSLRQILKNIKAVQKKRLSEFMQDKNMTFTDLKQINGLYLFNDISGAEFNEYKQKTEEIEEKAEKKNQCNNDESKKRLNSDLQRFRKDRGSLINAADKNTKEKFKTYKAFANIYRNVAQKHGRILSTINGIEKEQAESQLLKYWAVVIEENEQHNLGLIPKENAGELKKWLENNASPGSESPIKVYWFESLTLRSLRKLCFGYIENETYSNTFYPKLKISPELQKYKDNNGSFITGEFYFKGDEQRIIKFYKDVLRIEHTQKELSFPKQQVKDDILNKDFSSLDEFQIALEKVCYRRFVLCSSDIKLKLKNYGAEIFEITSLDLRNAIKTNIKNHTLIWKTFWNTKNESNNFDIRLNPEITITYRPPKQSRIDIYGRGSRLYDENKKNRYLHPQFTLITTISEHSNAPTKILSFMTDDEFKDSVDTFNKKLKKEDVRFSLGIDNGEAELSTLGIYLPVFKETPCELKKVGVHGFKVLTIKNLSYADEDTNKRKRKIIQNPSYFLNKDLYMRTFGKEESDYSRMFAEQFEEKTLLSLDLTTAKVINGRIVTNGDIPTFFNLWMRHAQRNVWDMNDHSKDKTAKKIILKNNAELIDAEKEKFIHYISDEKKYAKLTGEEKSKYSEWIFKNRDEIELINDEKQKFNNCQRRKDNFSNNIIFAVCHIGTDIHSVTDVFDVRHVFKKREDFYVLKSEADIIKEIESYNTIENIQKISNEELDLRINHLKQSVVANAIGVIDFLYNYYKKKTEGEGLIVKEGFDTKKVADGLEKFSGNIYRILERKLYQKFQNYGLVPPIKSLMSVRTEGIVNDKNAIMKLGNICFIDPAGTSQNCPVCDSGKLNHTSICSERCGFDSENIMHSNDGIAGYNIAKRGFENFIMNLTKVSLKND